MEQELRDFIVTGGIYTATLEWLTREDVHCKNFLALLPKHFFTFWRVIRCLLGSIMYAKVCEVAFLSLMSWSSSCFPDTSNLQAKVRSELGVERPFLFPCTCIRCLSHCVTPPFYRPSGHKATSNEAYIPQEGVEGIPQAKADTVIFPH